MPTHRFHVNYWLGHPDNPDSKPVACSGFNDPNKAMQVFMGIAHKHNPSHIEISGFSDEQLAKLGQERVRINRQYDPYEASGTKLPHTTTQSGFKN